MPGVVKQETVLRRRIAVLLKIKPDQDRTALEAHVRASAERAVRTYTELWLAWAKDEKPRRRSIDLYGNLFALKHQLEAQETAKPTEFVWGIGLAVWKLKALQGIFPFCYPLITQRVEISLDERSMLISIRPRATEPRTEMDAFAACQVSGASEVEKACRKQLTNAGRIVSPFDPGSYADVLKLAASNLDSKGSYRELLASHSALPEADEHLVVTDLWALFARPKAQNFLVEDLARLQSKLDHGCDIPIWLIVKSYQAPDNCHHRWYHLDRCLSCDKTNIVVRNDHMYTVVRGLVLSQRPYVLDVRSRKSPARSSCPRGLLSASCNSSYYRRVNALMRAGSMP